MYMCFCMSTRQKQFLNKKIFKYIHRYDPIYVRKLGNVYMSIFVKEKKYNCQDTPNYQNGSLEVEEEMEWRWAESVLSFCSKTHIIFESKLNSH